MSGTATANIAELDDERAVLSKEIDRVDGLLDGLLREVPVHTVAVARLCEEKRVYQERLRAVDVEEGRLVGDQWAG
jgi:hypothetical protein